METLPISTPIEDEEDDHFSDALDQIPSASPSPLKPNPNASIPTPTPNQEEPNNDDEDMEEPESNKKQKPISLFTPQPPSKRPKKKSNNVWTKPTSRKGKKKQPKSSTHTPASSAYPSSLTHHKTPFLTPTPTNPLRLSDDTPDLPVLLSRLYKADKVDLSDDRLTAGSSKGYRMVRATRGVAEGEWFFEIKITHLGPTGHCRLGWATENGDLQAPVGYDGFSYGYRDLEGSKVHRALRERYGEEGYGEGDVIGFYISLPDGGKFVPERRLHCLDWYKAGRGLGSTEKKEEEGPKVVPGSEISFFKNGVCQGVAYKDVSGGRYYPAASMYTMPNQPNCEVRFNFGPNFEFFPQDFGGRPIPRPMSEVPYHDFDVKVEAPTENGFHN